MKTLIVMLVIGAGCATALVPAERVREPPCSCPAECPPPAIPGFNYPVDARCWNVGQSRWLRPYPDCMQLDGGNP